MCKNPGLDSPVCAAPSMLSCVVKEKKPLPSGGGVIPGPGYFALSRIPLWFDVGAENP